MLLSKQGTTHLVQVLVLLCVAGFANIANAVVVSVDFVGNDCSGVMNPPDTRGFDNCNIWIQDGDDVLTYAPVIAKLDADGDAGDLSHLFEVDTEGQGTGSWEYTGDVEDPGVLFWAAKGGKGFTLYWDIDDADFIDNGGDCDMSMLYSVACLEAANFVTSGEYATPFNHKNGKHYGLSHLTFYGDQVAVVPVPAASWLFFSGLLGLLGMSRNRRR